MRVRLIRFGDLSGSATSLARHLQTLDEVEAVEDVDLLRLRGMGVNFGRVSSRAEFELSARRWTASKTGLRSFTLERALPSVKTEPLPTVVVGTVPAFVTIPSPYVVYTDRTYREGTRNDFGFRSRADPWWVSREERMLRRADHVFAFGPSTVESLLLDYGIESSKASFIGAGANIPPAPAGTLREHSDAVVRLVFVGREWERHGGPELVGAMRALPPSRFSLDVFGCSPESSLPHVHVHGRVDGATVSAAMAKADIYVRPSRQDAFPIAIVEALSFGVPVVCSNVANQPWMVGDAGRVVTPGDVSGLVAALEDAAAELPALRQRAMQRTDTLARYLSWDNVAQAIVDRLAQIAA